MRDWETDYSNDWELWTGDTAANRSLVEQALEQESREPRRALAMLMAAADAGSARAMQLAAWRLQAVDADQTDLANAAELLRRAIVAGAWSATVRYAALMDRMGRADLAEHVLRDGVAADFIPADFRLARLRYRSDSSPETAVEIRPLLERAAAHGHPAAGRMLAGMMASGRLGWREVAVGWRRLSTIEATFDRSPKVKSRSSRRVRKAVS